MKKIVKSLTATALVLGLITSVNTGLAGITVNAAETAAETSQASAATDAVTVDGNYMYNDYIKMYVSSSDAKFVLGTTGGDPSTTSDDNKKLIYGFPSNTWSSYSTIVIDDTVYKYGESTSFSTAPKYDASDKSNTSAVKYGKISVTQKLSFIKNVSTGREDVLEIKYIVKNTDTVAHNIGTRVMIDTMLGSNDSAPFRVAGVGNVTTETEFTGDNIPQYWQAFDSLTNPTVVSQGTFLRYGDSNKPDKVQFANWSRLRSTAWNYQIGDGSSNGDSAVTVTWNSKSLAAGKTRTFTTYYGLSELTQDLLPPLAVSVYGDNTVTYTSVDSSGLPQYSTLAVTAYIQNIGDANATNATAKIVLPSNFSLADGSQKVSLGTIKVGESKQATWNVKVAGNTPAGSYPIKIVCDSSETEAKTVERSVTVPSVIVNNSKLSEDAIIIGDTVTVTAAAKGGSGSYTYAVYYKKSTDTSWVTSQEFSTNKTVSIKPSKATKYQVLVKVKDANGTVSDKTLNLTVNNPLENTSKISAATINQGETIKATGSAKGGIAPYTYAFYYKKTSSTGWTTVQDFSSASTANIKPDNAGDYQICIKVKDSKGTVEKKYFDVSVKADALKNTSSISAATINQGETIKAKGSATGGTAPYTYAFYYKKASSTGWTTVQDFSSASTANIKPNDAGDYQICIKVKDSKGTVEKKYFDVSVKANTLKNTSSISSTSISIGATVDIKASATGGSGSYTYAVLYRREGTSKWTIKQNYSTNSTVRIKPETAKKYEVCVKVKDSSGKIEKKYLAFTVKSSLANNSTLSATSITAGGTVTVNGVAQDGSGSYSYAVYYRRTGTSKWTEAQAFKTNNKISIKPAAATDYEVCVKVKDSTGIIVKKYLTFSVKTALKNTSTLSASSIVYGDTISVNAAATGGTGSYTYAVYYRRTGTSKWTEKQDFSANKTVSIKPAAVTNYDVCIKVKDSSGAIVKKYVAFSVTKPFVNTSSVSLGDKITIKASATGGTAPYKYQVVYKRSTAENWTTKQSYSTNQSVSITPAKGITYIVRIDVKDSKNQVVSKTFKVCVAD